MYSKYSNLQDLASIRRLRLTPKLSLLVNNSDHDFKYKNNEFQIPTMVLVLVILISVHTANFIYYFFTLALGISY